MSEGPPRRRWVLPALLGGIALIVAVTVVVSLVRGGPRDYPADTPEGVVQRYTQAVIDRDFDAALGYVAPDIADACDESWYAPADYRVALLATDERGTTATVDVLITSVYGSGLLGPGESETEGSFRLVDDGGAWLIERAPWELAVCTELAS